MNKKDHRDIWVHIEHDGKRAAAVSLELCCEARRLCDLSGDRLFAVLAGALPEGELERIKDCGVDGLMIAQGEGYARYSTEAYTQLYTSLCRKYSPSAVFVGGTVNGRDFAPRFAARLETGCTSDATEICYNRATGDLEFIEPAAGGRIMAVITMPEKRPQVATVRPGTFAYAPPGRRESIELRRENTGFDIALIRTELLGYREEEYDPQLDVAGAEVIVCLGNGLSGPEALPRYRELARLLGGRIACSRPLYDREILPFRLQIGQSGISVRPRLYIGFGVSGAVNHITGVNASRLVAVNSDARAAIFNYCDYGIVGDMDEVCDAMIAALKAGGGKGL